jgi:hypothetical protein
MAAEPVTADQHPELTEFELTSEHGGAGRFVGRLAAEHVTCVGCGRTDATTYQGPQHGLAFDVPETPFTVAPVELALTWCPACGPTAMRLVNQDGTEHDGL